MPYFDLVFNIPSGRVFSYLGDIKGEAEFGKRAMVPFGNRDCLGYVIGKKDNLPPDLAEASVKPIRRLVDKEPIFDEGVIVGVCEFHRCQEEDCDCEGERMELVNIHTSEQCAWLEDMVADSGFRSNAHYLRDYDEEDE